MLRHRLLLILFVLTTTSFSANAAPTELVSCDELFKLSPNSEIYFNYLSGHYKLKGEFNRKKPFFTMYILPPREPESVIVVYESINNKFIVERLITQESIWYFLYDQTVPKHQNLTYLPEKPIFDMPAISSQRTRELSKNAAKLLQKTINTSLQHSKYDPNEFDDTKKYLHATMVYFVSSKNKCGWPFWGSADGPAKDMDNLGLLLEKYLDGEIEEQIIINASKKVLEHYMK